MKKVRKYPAIAKILAKAILEHMKENLEKWLPPAWITLTLYGSFSRSVWNLDALYRVRENFP